MELFLKLTSRELVGYKKGFNFMDKDDARELKTAITQLMIAVDRVATELNRMNNEKIK